MRAIITCIKVVGTGIIFIFWALFFTATHSSHNAPTQNFRYPGIGQDPLIGHPISMNCREAYTVLCPEYHGD